ncbi:MYG1 exonuclease-like [Ylistrum balloti]|uniref:MYG1 exonuclease-like n=1 Tax=Ylistrum balloti TaxID=509963 RepID=UPI0029058E4D|nr:MYG1 exonuclease-like [Ylistrum balloti]
MSTSSPPAKKAKSDMKIGTHNGSFHCDEVLACFLLRQLPKYKDAQITRTRDPALLDTCDIVVDVGGIFDAEKNRFDHHQRTFKETMNSLNPKKHWNTKLSSAGLVYLHFGHEVLKQILELTDDDPVLDIVYDKVYDNFVEEIDAVDNGIDQYDGEARYQISTTLSNRVRHLNPNWNEDAEEEVQFKKAYDMVGAEFLDRVLYYKKSWIPARELVEQAIKERAEVDPSGEIVTLKSGGCPWKDHLFNIEEEMCLSPKLKYVLYTDNSKKWRIQCVPLKIGSFENRLSLPEEWRGIRDAELSEKSGIPGCIFVHAGGFIGGNETYDGVLEMARRSLKQQNKNGS